MKKIFSQATKIIFIATFAVLAFFGVSVAKASANTFFNTNPLDYATTTVSNYTSQPGCTSCWTPSITMNEGQIFSVRIYYHNTGNEIAQDTHIRLSPKTSTAVNSKVFSGGVSANNASLVTGTATVMISGLPQTITYIPGTATWYPEHSLSPTLLNSTQESALFGYSGVSIGNIDKDSTCPISQTFCHQGSLVARFQIGTTPPPPPPVVYACSDQIDNDSDGLTDYPQDPGCYGPTDVDEFNTIYQTPFVSATTQTATNISQTDATLNGAFSTNQSQATAWFDWGTTQSLGNHTNTQTQYNQSGNFSAQIYGLSQNTTYYFRACADTNATSQNCGNILSFATVYVPQNNAPTAITNFGSCNATQNAFNMSGSFTTNNSNNYLNTSTWFQYGTNYPYTTQVGNQNQYGTSGNFNYTLTGLYPNTTYYFQAVAQNSAGTNFGTTYSCTTLPVQIITQNNPPSVSTVPASSVSQTTARLNGYLNSTGNYVCSVWPNCPPNVYLPNTDMWFEWGTTQNFGFTTAKQNNTVVTTYSNYLPNLSPNTTYYFRAIVQNNFGTATGTTLSFTTASVGVGPQIIYVNTNNGGSGPLVFIDMKSDFQSVCTNDTVRYSGTYENLTKKILKNVVVQVILPKEQTFLRATKGSYSDTANTITILVGNLSSREKGTFEIEAKINGQSKNSDTLVATATIVYTHPTNLTQDDAIAYSLINVTCGNNNNNLVGLALFGQEIGFVGWLLIILIIILAIYIVRKSFKY